MKKEYKNYIILIIIGLLLMIIPMGLDNIFGSKTDWVSQHSTIPEYFRNLFYSTKNLIPNFAANIGGGQNIFNFSYYGLLSPIILFSYLLPFVKMSDYIVVSSIITVIASTLLIYKWLRNNKFNTKISLVSSIIFLTSAPIMFHVHRHVMFINYIPFLILGLMGVDRYFNKNKKFLLIISVFLMIMTNYYYSVSGILVLIIYGIYKYLEKNKFEFKKFLKEGFKFLLPILLGIGLSAIILLPTIYVILNNGNHVSTIVTIQDLFPRLNFGYILYDPYSMGFTSIAVFALINNIYNKNKKFLLATLFLVIIFPVFIYLLNGCLYVRPKVLIPFLPLIILMISKSFTNIKDKSIYTFLLINMFILLTDFNKYYLIDSLVLTISLFIYQKYKKGYMIYVPIVLTSLILGVTTGYSVDYMDKATYNKYFNEKTKIKVEELLEKDRSYYRMNELYNASLTMNKVYDMRYYQTSVYSSVDNSLYRDFYFNIFNNNMGNRNNIILTQNNNVLFKTFMGIKYVISNYNVPGYKKIEKDIYQNDNAFPIGYASNVLSKTNIEYPYNVESILNSITVDNNNDVMETSIEKRTDLFDLEETYKLDNPKNMKLELNKVLQNQVLFISFDMNYNQSCSDGDVSIKINGITNKLSCKEHIYHNKNYTFNYALYHEKIDKLNITFSKGKYEISNIKIYTMPYEKVTNYQTTIDKLNITNMSDNVIEGSISVTNDGYFATTIPYDKGFSIYVDNEKIEYEKVNYAFLGFKINKGNHNITIKYESPLLETGKIISLISLVFVVVYLNKEKILKNK